ncbi:MAG: orotidine-5'-phosphate decarboxylase [Candidatus Omnitrophica bacterium]|nr:orotidine-5'-phosphate decarboxylase [Candidatus Omnitrophota bacterium]
MSSKPQIILALDVDNFQAAKNFVDKLYPQIKIFKVGIQLFTSCGREIIEYINNKGGEVFLDLKFFDIPNTVSAAVRQAVRLKVKMLTMHILGDEEMLKEAIKARDDEAKNFKVNKPLLIGVTVLTSKETTSSDVLTLARIGIECGLDGVVCSAREAGLLRKEINKSFVIVTPGIRPANTVCNDQKRTATVQEAIAAGSDFLVVGRPILKADDPLKAAKELM